MYICRLDFSAGRTPSFIADCCNVCQENANSVVFKPEVELAHLRSFILRYTNMLIIIRPIRAVNVRLL